MSLRDINRVIRVFLWFFKIIDLEFMLQQHKVSRPWTPIKRLLFRAEFSMVIAVLGCYYFRLNRQHRNEFERELDEVRRREIRQGLEALARRTTHAIIVGQFAYSMSFFSIPEGIALNSSLQENLFMLFMCTMCDEPIPLIIVGKPGSSKTLSVIIFRDSFQAENKYKQVDQFPDAKLYSFQCSKFTTSQAIKTHWRDCEKYQDEYNASDPIQLLRGIVFCDEMGLAEESEHRPLSTLHQLLDRPKIAFVGVSDWQLDGAKMNRVIQHTCPSFETADDLAELATTGRVIAGATKVFGQENKKNLIIKLAKFYLNVLEHQQIDHFFGARDFFAAVKYFNSRLNQRVGFSVKLKSVLF